MKKKRTKIWIFTLHFWLKRFCRDDSNNKIITMAVIDKPQLQQKINYILKVKIKIIEDQN